MLEVADVFRRFAADYLSAHGASQACAAAIIELARDPRCVGGTVAVLAVLHTWTQQLTLSSESSHRLCRREWFMSGQNGQNVQGHYSSEDTGEWHGWPYPSCASLSQGSDAAVTRGVGATRSRR
jgi:hypothetical protein